jgi:hypothetical protein
MRDEAREAVQSAERIVWVAGWRLQEAQVLSQLADTVGLARGRLEPRSEVIQLVTFDGEHLGHIRRDGSRLNESWVAVGKTRGLRARAYATAQAAAEALAVAAGKMPPGGSPPVRPG